MPIEQKTQVIGTTRNPNHKDGDISGLVIAQVAPGGGFPILNLATAIAWAIKKLLWTKIPGDHHPVLVIPVDGNNDGYYDFVKTERDGLRQNNLLSLKWYDTKDKVWRDPVTGAQTTAPTTA